MTKILLKKFIDIDYVHKVQICLPLPTFNHLYQVILEALNSENIIELLLTTIDLEEVEGEYF